MEKTNGMRVLDNEKIEYKIYDYIDSGAVSGVDVVEYLKVDPAQTYKTLVTQGKTDSYYVFVVPVTGNLDLKKAANAAGEKSVEMVKSKELRFLTGYVHGGCSPLGMKKTFHTIIDSGAEAFDSILFNAGKIGLIVEVSRSDLRKVLDFELADITVSE